MAGNMSPPSIDFILQNLKEFILYNSNLIGGLDEKVKTLLEDLDLMKAFVEEYAKFNRDNNAILQTLTDDVRNVVYTVEDAIEESIICRTLQQRRGFWSKASHLFGYVSDLKGIGKRIEDVSAKVRIFLQVRAPLGLDALRVMDEANKGEKIKKKFEQILVAEEDNVVGFGDEAETIIKLLTGESKELEIISIIGMLGLGKTTLAMKVLNDPKVEYEFFSNVFVNVSQEYDKREVFINILSALECKITPDMQTWIHVVEKLRKELGKRKYLIVLDDVCTTTAWDDLKVAFPNNEKGSRVLITSRYMQVALYANPLKDPHRLRFMNGDESRELLRKRVFGENACPPRLMGYELRILDKCAGLPLAIVVVAGILLNRREMDYWWEKVANSVGDYVALDESKPINDVIQLSLNHLPHHKKACFLYFGVFREDFEIPVGKLLRLWIAEGFIQEDGDMTLEDIAEDYMEGLVDRSLVMVVRRRSNGKIKTCCIHSTLRDFCRKEAPKQNLFKEIKWSDQSTSLADGPALQSYRRICVNSNVKEYITSKPSGDQVRSFMTSPKEEITVPPAHISSIPKAFKRLRVLDVKSLKFHRFPPELMYLVLLKYIAMFCDFKIIPKEFSNLRNLQTIIIDTTSGTLEIRADISKLALLRHLLTNASASLEEGTVPLVANINLQTLCTISPESCTKELFERYPKLKKLGIRGNLAIVIAATGESALFDTLLKLVFLENLKLINYDDCPLHVLPRETNFPGNLKMLTLVNTFLKWSQISTLGKLQMLEVLKLKHNAFDGELWDTEDGGFRCLKVLKIEHTRRLISWKANASHFPMLTSLYLRHCANLEAIPCGISGIPSLQTIELEFCTKPSVAVSARKIRVQKLLQAHSHFKLGVYPPDQDHYLSW